jgi:hypothetical protein
MPALVTNERYVALTGDSDSSKNAITQALIDAQEMLEESLGRGLAEEERTERLPIYYSSVFDGGRVYPRCTPITTADDYTIVDSYTLSGASPSDTPFFGTTDQYGEITYTGGYIERTAVDDENPNPTNKLPAYVESDIIWAAYSLLHAAVMSQIPNGAKSVSVGDLSVTFNTEAGSKASTSIVFSRKTASLARRSV